MYPPMDFYKYAQTKLTKTEYRILVNHTQPHPKTGYFMAKQWRKSGLSWKTFKRTLEKLEDVALTWELQQINDGILEE